LDEKIDKYFQENKPTAGLGRASLHSGMIIVTARCVSILSQVVSMIILGRLLSPRDFGLTAMIFALIGFGPMLIDLGTSEASNQKTNITKAEVSFLFWMNTAIGAVLTLLLAGSGNLIAGFYGEPALNSIAIVSSLTFIASGVSIQHSALLRRAMQFRSLAIIDIVSNVVSSLLSVGMAFTGWGYWSLVIKPVATTILTAIGVWVSCPWLPQSPRHVPEARESIRFGVGVAGFTVTDYIAKSTDRIALGYFYGADLLGYYQNAFLLYSNLLSLLSDPLHNIAVSGLSKLRTELSDFKKSWATALSSVSFLAALAFALLAVTGPDFIVLLLGQKWAPAGPVLCIFAVRGIAQTIERTLGWLHVSAGRSDRWMRWGFISAACQIASVFMGLPFGITGVAISCTIAIYILFIPALVYAGRPMKISAKEVMLTVGPQTAAGLIAVALGLIVRETALADLSVLTRFIVSGLVCASIYLAAAVIGFRVTGPLRLALSVLRDFRPLRLS
jgi:PST family polysaccharide transporter